MYAELKQVWQSLTGPEGNFEITTVDVRGGSPRRLIKTPRRACANSGCPPSNLPTASTSFTKMSAGPMPGPMKRWRPSLLGWWRTAWSPGDRVALAMRNYPEFMLIYWAIASIGATVVGMNAWWVTPEMRYGLSDSEPKFLFLDEERYTRIKDEPELPGNPTLVALRFEAPEGAVAYETLRDHGGSLPEVTIDPDSDACIFYTSGTTGNPKGALQTHRGCVNNVMNLAFWGACLAGTQVALGNAKPEDFENPPQGVSLITTPSSTSLPITARPRVARSAAGSWC